MTTKTDEQEWADFEAWFEADRQRRGEPVGYVLMENGKAVAFFDEIPTDGHYAASAYTPVGLIGKPAEPVKVPSYCTHPKCLIASGCSGPCRYGQPAQPAASVTIDFDQIGRAGPFPFVDGRVSVPAITVMDLVRMARPAASAEPMDTRCSDCKENRFSWCPHNQPEPEWRRGRPCKGLNCGAMKWQDHSPECEAQHAATIAGGTFLPAPVAAQPSVPELVAPWIRVHDNAVIASRCRWAYPHATDDDAGRRDECRYAAIGGRDGDIQLNSFIERHDLNDLKTMLSWPVAAQPSVPNGLIAALRNQRQIDRDGSEVAVSRQAVDEAADLLDKLATPPAAAQAQQDAEKVDAGCTWTLSEGDEWDAWDTSCGEAFAITDGTPEENGIKHCCYCGGHLSFVRAQQGGRQ